MKIWNLLLYVDLETSSKIKLICVPTQYYWSIPFSAVNSIFFHFFMCMPDTCRWGTNYTCFSNYYLLRFLSPYEYWSEVSFGGSTPDLDPAPDPYLGCNFLTLIQGPPCLQLQSHLCLTLDHVGVNSGSGSSSRSIFGLYILTWIFTVLILC